MRLPSNATRVGWCCRGPANCPTASASSPAPAPPSKDTWRRGGSGRRSPFPPRGCQVPHPIPVATCHPVPVGIPLAAVAELRLLTLVSFYRRSTLTDIRTTPRRGKIGLQTRIPVIVGVATVGLLGSAPAAATLAVVAPASAQARSRSSTQSGHWRTAWSAQDWR